MIISEPLVCLCVPCYNNEITIYETLNSLVNQTYKNIVIKVFDNASTDGSIDVINNFVAAYERIQLFTLNQTIPAEENFTRCIQFSEGEYSAIYHSDDVYHPEMVKLAVEFLNENKQCGAVATKSNLINAKGERVSETFLPKELVNKKNLTLSQEELIRLVFEYGNFVCCPSVMFKTSLLKNNIKYFNNYKYKTSSDLDVWFRVSEIMDFGFINKPLISYRLSPVSYSYNLAKTRVTDNDMFLVLNDYLKCLDSSLVQRRDFLLAQDRYATNMKRILLGVSGYQQINLINLMQFCIKNNKLKFLIKVTLQKLLLLTPFHRKIYTKYMSFKSC